MGPIGPSKETTLLGPRYPPNLLQFQRAIEDWALKGSQLFTPYDPGPYLQLPGYTQR